MQLSLFHMFMVYTLFAPGSRCSFFSLLLARPRSKLCVSRCEIPDAEDIGLGLILDVGGNHATVAYVRPHGLLDRWNRRCQSVREQFSNVLESIFDLLIARDWEVPSSCGG